MYYRDYVAQTVAVACLGIAAYVALVVGTFVAAVYFVAHVFSHVH